MAGSAAAKKPPPKVPPPAPPPADLPASPDPFDRDLDDTLDALISGSNVDLDEVRELAATRAGNVGQGAVWSLLQGILDGAANLQPEELDTYLAELPAAITDRWGNPDADRIGAIVDMTTQGAIGAAADAALSDPESIEGMPYRAFFAVLDSSTTMLCSAFGEPPVVLPAGHPWFQTHSPPCHFACRSWLTGLTAEMAGQLGIRGGPDLDCEEGFGSPGFYFGYAPVETDYEDLMPGEGESANVLPCLAADDVADAFRSDAVVIGNAGERLTGRPAQPNDRDISSRQFGRSVVLAARTDFGMQSSPVDATEGICAIPHSGGGVVLRDGALFEMSGVHAQGVVANLVHDHEVVHRRTIVSEREADTVGELGARADAELAVPPPQDSVGGPHPRPAPRSIGSAGAALVDLREEAARERAKYLGIELSDESLAAEAADLHDAHVTSSPEVDHERGASHGRRALFVGSTVAHPGEGEAASALEALGTPAYTSPEHDGVVRRTTFAGFPIAIENDAGSVRRWHDADGNETGATVMRWPYGFVEGHLGEDGEELDCYLGPDERAPCVYIVHQLKTPDYAAHDEMKVMLGWPALDGPGGAREAYLAHRNDGDRAIGSVTVLPVETFRAKLRRRSTGRRIHASVVDAAIERFLEQLYSPDQPRQADGRFGEGGAGGTAAPKAARELPKLDVRPASVGEFKAAFEKAFPAGSRFENFVTHYTPEQLATFQRFVTTDGKVGVAVHDHGDGRIEGTALFNNGGPRDSGKAMLQYAVEHGKVNYCECFGGTLDKMYSGLGFRETARYPFDAAQAPGWNQQLDDQPDYIIMAYRPNEKLSAWDDLNVWDKAAEDPPRFKEEMIQQMMREKPGLTRVQAESWWGAANAQLGLE